MATFTGGVPESPVLTRDQYYLVDALDELEQDYWPAHESLVGDVPSLAAQQDNVPVTMSSQQHAGGIVPSYGDDWYENLHILSNPIDLGNLVSAQTRTIEVWNSYRRLSRTLNALNASGNEGLVLTEPESPPTVFAPLESREYELSVSLSGPPAFAAEYEFQWDVATITLEVTGVRVIPWPFRPNWQSPVLERLQWLTQVLESKNGQEQRIRLRQHPRRTFEYQLLATENDRALLEAHLWEWQARTFALPIWSDPQFLGANLVAGSTTVTVATAGYGFQDGGLLALFKDSRHLELVEIDTVGAGSITLARGTEQTWSAGTRVFPAILARIGDSQAIRRLTATIGQATLRWQCIGNEEIPGAEKTAATYLGYPVLEDSPNWAEDLRGDYQRALAVLDNVTGRDAGVDDRRGTPQELQAYSVLLPDRGAIWAHREWLHQRAGRLSAIWVISRSLDIRLAATIGSTDTTITVLNDGYARFLQEAEGRRDIRIRLTDGTEFYRRITASSEVDEDSEQLVIDSSLGQVVSVGEAKIQFMTLVRLESDLQEIAWLSAGVARAGVALRSVADDV